MLIIFVIVFSLAMCSIIWLLFPLESIKECWAIVKYIYKTKKVKRRQAKIKIQEIEIVNNKLIV